MKEGTFTFNGINSEHFGVYVSSTPARVPPQSVWAVGNPSNRNGSVYRNLGVFTNSQLVLNIWFSNLENNIDDIFDWLLTDDYVTFTPWYDDKYTYKVLANSDSSFEIVDSDSSVTTVKLTLTVYPLKYINANLIGRSVTNNSTFTNPTKFKSLPYFEVTPAASGDVTITLNGVVFTFKNPGSKFTIDSEIPRTSIPSKMVGLDFPMFKSGTNTISYTNVSLLTVIDKFVRRAA